MQSTCESSVDFETIVKFLPTPKTRTASLPILAGSIP